jgi:hypothetical protein
LLIEKEKKSTDIVRCRIASENPHIKEGHEKVPLLFLSPHTPKGANSVQKSLFFIAF